MHSSRAKKVFYSISSLNNKYLLNVVNSMRVGILICNLDYTIEMVNDFLINELGDPVNKSCYEYLYNKKSVCAFCNNNGITSNKPVISEWNNPKTGKFYKITESFLKNTDGSVSKLRLFLDITEQKSKVQYLEKSHNKLESPVNEIITQSESRINEENLLQHASCVINKPFKVENLLHVIRTS